MCVCVCLCVCGARSRMANFAYSLTRVGAPCIHLHICAHACLVYARAHDRSCLLCMARWARVVYMGAERIRGWARCCIFQSYTARADLLHTCVYSSRARARASRRWFFCVARCACPSGQSRHAYDATASHCKFCLCVGLQPFASARIDVFSAP